MIFIRLDPIPSREFEDKFRSYLGSHVVKAAGRMNSDETCLMRQSQIFRRCPEWPIIWMKVTDCSEGLESSGSAPVR